ncbi:MAG: ribbon-helix-helix domain-containing protein [Candidatus Komeilibacteria bacterium]
MREILNLSLPSEMAQSVKKAVKKGQYASTSEFIRSLIRDWQESQLLSQLEQSQTQIKQGNSRVLKSLRDLR